MNSKQEYQLYDIHQYLKLANENCKDWWTLKYDLRVINPDHLPDLRYPKTNKRATVIADDNLNIYGYTILTQTEIPNKVVLTAFEVFSKHLPQWLLWDILLYVHNHGLILELLDYQTYNVPSWIHPTGKAPRSDWIDSGFEPTQDFNVCIFNPNRASLEQFVVHTLVDGIQMKTFGAHNEPHDTKAIPIVEPYVDPILSYSSIGAHLTYMSGGVHILQRFENRDSRLCYNLGIPPHPSLVTITTRSAEYKTHLQTVLAICIASDISNLVLTYLNMGKDWLQIKKAVYTHKKPRDYMLVGPS